MEACADQSLTLLRRHDIVSLLLAILTPDELIAVPWSPPIKSRDRQNYSPTISWH